jgi:hypothetical protein
LAVSNNNLLYESLFEPASPSSSSSSLQLLRPSLSASFVRLEVLVLNSVPDAWSSAVTLARHGALPNLQELHLCKNNIMNLSSALQQQQQQRMDSKAVNADSTNTTVPSSAAMSAELAALFPSLRTLELSFNALRDWAEVRLLERLPRLTKLLLNDNVLTSVEYDGDDSALASTPASSASAASSSSSAAAASASSTDSSSFTANAPFGALVSLGLNSNDLVSFDSVTALSRFPALRELRAQGNLKLEQITMSLNSAAGSAGAAAGASAASAAAAAGGAPTAAPADPFQAAIQQLLSSVSIDGAHNLVSTFGDAAVAAAARAPASTVAGAAAASSAPDNTAFVSSRESAALLRFQLIARLPRVTSLNRSALSARERIDAEKYYVLTACQALHRLTPAQREALLKPTNPADGATGAGDHDAAAAAAGPLRGVDALFPRYTELVSAHGDPAPTMSALQKAQMEPSGSTLASKLVEVTLVLAEPSSVAPSAEDAPAPPSSIPLPTTLPGLRVRAAASKKLSSSLTVQAARQLLDKTFKLPAHRKAAYVMQWYEGTLEAGADAAAHPLDEPLKTLNYFGVCNGAFIVLLRKD